MSTDRDLPCYIRPVVPRDRSSFLAHMVASRSLHQPWISPPINDKMFDQYLARLTGDDHEGYLICRENDDDIVGVVNLNGIVRGSFLCASLGYYACITSAGQGYMSAGLRLVIRHAFTDLGLHRLEANIQPANLRSIALARSCGFEFEGMSARYLFIDGAWRDHERWAIRDVRDTLLPAVHR